jgi:hypothetical protein
VARSPAVTGSAQPVSGYKVIVDWRPARPTGLNTKTGPRRARSGARSSCRSVRVLVTSAAPGASRTSPAISPVLPTRGPPKTSTTSSIEAHTVCHAVRHSRTATSRGGSRQRRRRDNPASDGRTVAARRRIAEAEAWRDVQRGGDAGLARVRALHRTTTPADRAHRFHPTKTATVATAT